MVSSNSDRVLYRLKAEGGILSDEMADQEQRNGIKTGNLSRLWLDLGVNENCGTIAGGLPPGARATHFEAAAAELGEPFTGCDPTNGAEPHYLPCRVGWAKWTVDFDGHVGLGLFTNWSQGRTRVAKIRLFFQKEWDTSVSDDDVKEERSAAQSDLKVIFSHFDLAVRQLKVYTSSNDSATHFQRSATSYYEAAQVNRVAGNATSQLIEGLQRNNLNALARYVQLHQPSMSEIPASGYVKVEVATLLFRAITSLFDVAFRNVEELAVDVKTATTPTGVDITLSTGAATLRHTVSNVGFKNLYRGTYSIRASRVGYREYVGKDILDFVDTTPTAIVALPSECVSLNLPVLRI